MRRKTSEKTSEKKSLGSENKEAPRKSKKIISFVQKTNDFISLMQGVSIFKKKRAIKVKSTKNMTHQALYQDSSSIRDFLHRSKKEPNNGVSIGNIEQLDQPRKRSILSNWSIHYRQNLFSSDGMEFQLEKRSAKEKLRSVVILLRGKFNLGARAPFLGQKITKLYNLIWLFFMAPKMSFVDFCLFPS